MSKFNLVRLMWYRNKVKWKYRTVSGTPPLTYKAKSDGVLKNYRIYGNTVNGESVGDLVTDSQSEHYGEYAIPITNNSEIANIYLNEPLRMVGDEAEYIDYGEQKQHRVRKNLCQINKTNNAVISHAIEGQIYTFSLTADFSVGFRILKRNADSGSTETVASAFNREGRVSATFTANENFDVYVNGFSAVGDKTFLNSVHDFMFEKGATASEYEPYIENTEVDVILPGIAVTAGTNTLTVGTEVQPSKVYLKGKIEEIPTRTVSYYSQDGSTLLGTETVESGGNASGLQDTPTKPDTEQYTYTFVGWSNTTNATTAMSGILNNITADKSVYAAFSETEKTFTVTFYNGAELIYTAQNVSYNGTAVYSGATPTKAETSEYTYTFAGWNTNSSASTADADALTNVTADRTVYAIFTAVSKGYTVYFYNGETLLETVTGVPSGGTATYTGTTPTSSQTGYIFDGWNPSNTNITADTSCYAQFKKDEMYESITDTWSEIIANVSNGTYSTKYHIGDTKKIDLGTQGEVIMTIVGIDTDDLADNSGKAPITWISKQLLKTDHRMNPAKQSGTSGTGSLGGWEKTEMRSYLKETVKPLIPETVRNAIKPVKKYSKIYNVSGSAVNDVLTTEDVWIPSYKEVFGSGLETKGPTYSTAFPDKASRIKSKAGSSAAWWWLRSPLGDVCFYYVYVNGTPFYTLADSTTGGVTLGFCT